MNNNLINFNNPKNIVDFLKQPIPKIANAITGILNSDKKEWMLSVNRLFQASLKSKFFKELGEELEKYRQEGKIKTGVFEESTKYQSLCEMLRFIDEEVPDEAKFKAMKSLFIKSLHFDSTNEDQVLSYQLMKICKKLNSEDLLILKATFDIHNRNISKKVVPNPKDFNFGNTEVQNWLAHIANQIGHGIKSLVEMRENKLIELKLISPRSNSLTRINGTPYYRLTESGYRLCKFIYEKLD